MFPPESHAPERSVIGIGELAVRQERGLIVTYALGSCLGIAIHDPVVRVGAMMHAQLPETTHEPLPVREALFVDNGIQHLLEAALHLGARFGRLRVTVAGGARLTLGEHDLFNIGKRNLTTMRRVMWKVGLLIHGEDTGGTEPRTMTLDVGSGQTLITSAGRSYNI